MSGAEKLVLSSFAMLAIAIMMLVIMITMPGGIVRIFEMRGWRLKLLIACVVISLFLLFWGVI
ncbi:hypothetical protein [Anaerotruncus rubiinfantis]|uniref:hypothetical protein n=1 Tax=Anaerotruncus rubiinfantis TaxID=1720200 RepID=UPI0011CB4818|nr:hypothetical protein [Anaerotruncus rubiinfantis]